MTIKHFLSLGLSARICSGRFFFFFFGLYRHQPWYSKALLYLADKFCPQMSAHCLLLFVSLTFCRIKSTSYWVHCRALFLAKVFWNLSFACFGTNLGAQVAQFGRIDGSGLGGQPVMFSKVFEQGYLRELACKADKAFLLLIIHPTHTHTHTQKFLFCLFKETGYPYCLQAENSANVSKNKQKIGLRKKGGCWAF